MSSPDSNDSKAVSPAGAGKPTAKPERSTEQNLMLAFALAAVVMLGTQYFMPQTPAPTPKKAEQKAEQKSEQGAPPSAAPTPTPAASQLKPGSAPAPERIAAASEQTQVIETDLYRVTFTNKGALVRNWVLKKYKDSGLKPLDVVNSKLASKGLLYPFSLEGADWKPLPVVNEALYTATLTPDKLGIDFEFSDGVNYAKKSFRFGQGKYIVEFSSTVRERGIPKQNFVAWRGGFGDGSVISAAASQQAVFYDANQLSSSWLGTTGGRGKLNTKTARDASDGPQVNRGGYSFAGLSDTYFAAVALPDAATDFRLTAVSNTLPNVLDGKEEAHVGALIGGETSNRFSMFIGPKDIGLMRGISPRLETLVDWGWWGFIAKPLFAVLHWVNDGFVHNWGWSIVVVTILVNLLTLPFRYSGLKASRKMALVQPELKKLQEKYAGMSMRDPRRAQQNEEMMALYSKHGVNPISGCIPNALILPVALAFYTALKTVIELRGADWLWVADLSRPETLAIRALPILMLVTQLLTMKMMPQPGGDPTQQKMMMLMMPIMLVFFMYNQSSGLVLYWLTSNVVGIAQQMIFNRLAPAPVLPPVAAKSAAKKK